jgi:hypothetical protein
MCDLDQSRGSGNSNTDPPNVNILNFELPKVLFYGIDSLYLSYKLEWKKRESLEFLEKEKSKAELENTEVEICFENEDKSEEFKGYICPYGTKGGYKYVLKNNYYKIQIADWDELKQTIKPNLMVIFSAECLCTLGPKAAEEKITRLFGGLGANIISIKPNRVDLCVDILLDEAAWTTENIIPYSVTRSRKVKTIHDNQILETINFGTKDIQARLYDKIREILCHRDKLWMISDYYLEHLAPQKKIIRIEFQIRRSVLKELGIDTISDLFEHSENLWAYCTQEWLKFQDNPGKHHTQQKTLPWWEVIQKGYLKNQTANPLIRCKAIQADSHRLFNQAYGLMSSFTASNLEASDPEGRREPKLIETLKTFQDKAVKDGKGNDYFLDSVKSKRTKYYRAREKFEEANKKRKELGFPVV